MSIKKIVRKIYEKLKKVKALIKYNLTRENIILTEWDAECYLQEIIPPLSSTALTENKLCSMKYDLMIIIPAYNSEKWIKKCVESIIFQKTEYSFLAVFVNDGSTDYTGMILDNYLDNQHVKIIHQKNKGYSGARNVALKEINSKYIMFVDSDDFLLPGAIQTLLSKAILEDADIVEGNGYKFNESGYLGSIKVNRKKDKVDDYWGGPCLKVMKSELWRNLEFPEGYLYEDTIIGALIFPLANKIYCLPKEVYAYRIHDDSITQKHDSNLRRVDSYWIMLLMLQLQKKFDIPLDYANYRRVMKQVVFTFRRIVLLPDDVKKAVFVGTSAFVRENFNTYMNTKDEYYLLSKALLNKDYAKYSIYCKELA